MAQQQPEKAVDSSIAIITMEAALAKIITLKSSGEQILAKIFSDMMQAAELLNIQGLIDLIKQKMADWMTGNTLEDIRRAFNLTDEEFQLTPEKDEEISRRLEIISRRRIVGAF
ncbi:SKP1-like protein 1B [Papaver somniferum]|uniref:SKP1-like protein 1B n=1 Tax=Papaver somniferum TaxID=3469 RepID=UPI000E6FF91C|nr:SKP1-like protein 1B [Papaver somniferum]